MDNALKTTCEKMEKSYAEVMAVQPAKVDLPSKKGSKMIPKTDIDLNIRQCVRIQGIHEDPTKSKAENFFPNY